MAKKKRQIDDEFTVYEGDPTPEPYGRVDQPAAKFARGGVVKSGKGDKLPKKKGKAK